jgi:hypothetical protein
VCVCVCRCVCIQVCVCVYVCVCVCVCVYRKVYVRVIESLSSDRPVVLIQRTLVPPLFCSPLTFALSPRRLPSLTHAIPTLTPLLVLSRSVQLCTCLLT